MKYLIIKDRRNRLLYNLYERRRKVLRAIIENLSLPLNVRSNAYNIIMSLPRETSSTRMRNRCNLTGRSRGIYKRFGVSRLIFRKLAWEGLLSGIKKSSWLFEKIINVYAISSNFMYSF